VKTVKGILTQLPPGTVLSGLCGVAQIVSFSGPFGVFDGYDFVAVISGYESFVLPLIMPPLCFTLVVPLCAIVATVGLMLNYRKPPDRTRKWAKFTIWISLLSTACLVWEWLAEGCNLEFWGVWLALLLGLFILIGNIVDIRGIDWSSFEKLKRRPSHDDVPK
jgi:hypothetical protein